MIEAIFQKIEKSLPEDISGIDRQEFLGGQITRLPLDERQILQKQFYGFLARMKEVEASDIEVGGACATDRIWFRILAKKAPQPELCSYPPLHAHMICHSLLSENQRAHLLITKALDFSFGLNLNGKPSRWRASMYFDLNHLALNMRAIADEVYPYKQLGFHPNISKSLSLNHEKQGLVLLTGITGSGKSTTLDSIIDANNRTSQGHIVIIGDPIEHIHQSDKCIIRHREVGRDVLSFKEGAVQALRQDPDIIVVGEMRDPDTMMACLEITDTGHKVFSTLHTGSAVESIDRIVAECPSEEQDRVRNRLADVLRVIISQKLIPSLDNKLVLAKEVMLVTSSVKAAIRNKNTQEIYQMISEGGKSGMVSLEQDLVRLYNNRFISKENAIDFANNKKRIYELLNHLQ